MIFKIKNRVTSVIAEAKLNVSDTLNFEMRDDLAQLFLEAEYADKLEDGWHENTVCALTDGMTWHFFIVHMRAKPLQFVKYVCKSC